MERPLVKVKICSVQRVEDALTAAEAGADFIGLVFVPNRRRRVTLAQAARIAAAVRDRFDHPPKVVGLFADQPLAEVREAAAACGLDAAQLCGAESPEYCDASPVPVFKAVHVPAGTMASAEVEDLAERVRLLRDRGHMVILDRRVEGLQGGTGASFDWAVAAEISRRGLAFMLAGGLTPDNVDAAIRTALPLGVDVSSGVESHGVKDLDKIRRFVANARETGKAIHGEG